MNAIDRVLATARSETVAIGAPLNSQLEDKTANPGSNN